MTGNQPSGSWTDFNEQQRSRLRTLNEQLEQAEQWIDRRSREMVTAYGLARHTERLDEDVELIATILFLLREDHPDSLPGRTNIVTRIDIPILYERIRAALKDRPIEALVDLPLMRDPESLATLAFQLFFCLEILVAQG